MDGSDQRLVCDILCTPISMLRDRGHLVGNPTTYNEYPYLTDLHKMGHEQLQNPLRLREKLLNPTLGLPLLFSDYLYLLQWINGVRGYDVVTSHTVSPLQDFIEGPILHLFLKWSSPITLSTSTYIGTERSIESKVTRMVLYP